MKWVIFLILGVFFLIGAAFYGFASAPDYSLILTYCLVLDVMSLASFVVSYRTSGRLGKILSVVLAVVAIGISIQAIYRLIL